MKKITDIYCSQCGAPANYDIKKQSYQCEYCGAQVGIKEAQQQKQGFREMRAKWLQDNVKQYQLFSATCDGCGATVVFEENEALTNCAFCGRKLIRTDYLDSKDMPESVIPFAITQQEAQQRLSEWCQKNSRKEEAEHLKPLIKKLKGFYLPYEMIRGPISMKVSRMDAFKKYDCEGFINDEFVNRSKQLDNLLLDGMEPFDIDRMVEFDFAYVAGQRVKISDVNQKDLEYRVKEEVAATYTPSVRKILETKAVEVDASVDDAVRLPVLLPVYYVSQGKQMAAVNGQTGKVSVRAEKESRYIFLPWWLKAILATVISCGIAFGAFTLFGMPWRMALFMAGCLALILMIVTLCVYVDTARNDFVVESGREIYTSGGKSFHRERGQLVQDDKILERKVYEPVFFGKIKGKMQPVQLRFTTPRRVFKIVALSFIGLFLPVMLALLINGFNFKQLEIGAAAPWFCIAVPIVPVYVLKFGIVDLYDNPWVYRILDNGKTKRYKEKIGLKIDKDLVIDILKALFIPPVSLAVWFGIALFITMIYCTAFGF